MREIKFRAWNKRDGEWADINQLTDWGSCEITACVGMGNKIYPYQTMRIESDAIYELMQYTGLKDKNGKEIYEGDVVSIKPNFHIAEPHVVVNWDKDELAWSFGCHTFVIDGALDEIEVIGNIYENEDLITRV